MKQKPQKSSPQRALSPETISVPEAGARLGISKNSAYEAARKGQIPAIRIGHLLRVPTAALERLLAGEAPAAPTRKIA